MIDFPAEKIQAAGNTALLGAKLALFSLDEHDGSYSELRKKIRHISLNEDPGFHEIYVEQMQFPDGKDAQLAKVGSKKMA